MSGQKRNDWQTAANHLRVEPSPRVWHRLEGKLDQDKGKVEVQVVRRWLAVAASVVLATAVAYWTVSSYHYDLVQTEELRLETPQPSFAVYTQVGDLNAQYATQSWKRINEGPRHARLVPPSTEN